MPLPASPGQFDGITSNHLGECCGGALYDPYFVNARANPHIALSGIVLAPTYLRGRARIEHGSPLLDLQWDSFFLFFFDFFLFIIFCPIFIWCYRLRDAIDIVCFPQSVARPPVRIKSFATAYYGGDTSHDAALRRFASAVDIVAIW